MSGLFFFKQKTAYERRISDWSSDVCSSDLVGRTDDTSLRRDGDVAHRAVREAEMDDRGVARCLRDAIIVKICARKIGARGGDLRVGVDRACARQAAPAALLPPVEFRLEQIGGARQDRKSTRLNSSH